MEQQALKPQLTRNASLNSKEQGNCLWSWWTQSSHCRNTGQRSLRSSEFSPWPQRSANLWPKSSHSISTSTWKPCTNTSTDQDFLSTSFFLSLFKMVWCSWSSSYCCVLTPDFPSESAPITYLFSFIQYLYFLKSCTMKLGLKWIPKLTWTGKGIRQTTKSSGSRGSRPWHESYLKSRNFKSWFKPR